jgi:hypothetical protein
MRRMRAQANMEGKSLYAVCSRVSLGRDLFLTGLGNFAIFTAIRRASSRLSSLTSVWDEVGYSSERNERLTYHNRVVLLQCPHQSPTVQWQEDDVQDQYGQ